MPPLRLGYCRVSTSEQSCDPQRAQLLDVARARGVELDAILEEAAGGTRTRASLDGIERQARSGKVSELWVVSLDRLGRSVLDVLGRVQRLDAAGCRVVVLREGLDLATPAGRLQAQLLSAFAEFERAIISERTRAALSAARRRGVRLGRRSVAVDLDRVAALRLQGRTWSFIRSELGISAGTLARALAAIDKRGAGTA